MDITELPRHVDALVKTTECKGHVLLYLDGKQVKVSGNLDSSAVLSMFGPAILEVLAKRFK